MTRNAELFDAMLKVAVGVLILAAWTYVVLDQRDLRRALRRQRTQLHQHRRAIVQLQGAAIQPPTSVGQPMPTIKVRARNLDCPAPNPSFVDPDRTLRLARPPALSDVEHVLTQAGRALTSTELADRMGCMVWDLLPGIDRLVREGKIQSVPCHTAGRTAYQLADTDTLRLPRGMSVLPGVSR